MERKENTIYLENVEIEGKPYLLASVTTNKVIRTREISLTDREGALLPEEKIESLVQRLLRSMKLRLKGLGLRNKGFTGETEVVDLRNEGTNQD